MLGSWGEHTMSREQIKNNIGAINNRARNFCADAARLRLPQKAAAGAAVSSMTR
jgi:hypothetical protein